jgi:hypothetical protein
MVPLQVAGGGERELTAITLQVSELLSLTMKILSAKTVFACAIIASVALAHSRPAGLEVTIKLLKMVWLTTTVTMAGTVFSMQPAHPVAGSKPSSQNHSGASSFGSQACTRWSRLEHRKQHACDAF